MASAPESPGRTQASLADESKMAEALEALEALSQDAEKQHEVKEAAMTLHKWLGIHVIPRIVCLAVETATVFCPDHMGSEAALEDLNAAHTLEAMLTLTKERFFGRMRRAMLMVVPNVEEAKCLLSPPHISPGIKRHRVCVVE